MFPTNDELTVCFAHIAYDFAARYAARATATKHFQAWSQAEFDARIGEADVVVVSGLWRNDLIDYAPKLKFVQSISAGTDQYAKDLFAEHGIRLASAAGVNARAVSEHALSLILALSRRLGEARDNQGKRHWRGMIGDRTQREDELGGKTMIVVGLGRIGGRLAQLGKALDMTVIGIRQNPASGAGAADSVHPLDELKSLLPRADFVVLTCPLTPQTDGLIDADALARMKPSAFLVNVARGRCVDEAALVAALSHGDIAGAGIDVTAAEPLPDDSPLWSIGSAFITPHTAGETRRYEDTVLDILEDNLNRLWRGEADLRNQVV